MTSTLILGRSGTFKTTAAQHLIRHIDRNKRLAVSDKPFANAENVALDQTIFGRLSQGCAVIIDDLVLPSNESVSILRRLIVESTRRFQLTLILIAHSILSNNIASLPCQMSRILISKSKANNIIFNQVRRILKIEQREGEREWRQFLDNPDPRGFLCIGVDKSFRTELVGVIDDEEENSKKGAIARRRESGAAERQEVRRRTLQVLCSLGGSEHERLMEGLYDYINNAVQGDFIDPSDLSVTIDTSEGKQTKTSFPDLLWFMTRSDTTPPPEDVRLLFHALSKKITIPYAFVKNNHLKLKRRLRDAE